MRDGIRRLCNLVFALALFPAASFSSWSGIGRPVGDIGPGIAFSPEVPAGYAFSIWPVIFLLTLAYAIRQALPGFGDRELYRRIGNLTAISSLSCCIWMVLAQIFGNGWWLIITIVAFFACALPVFFRVLGMADRLDRFDRWIVMPTSGLLAAWLSAAIWLNLAGVVKIYDPSRLGLTTTQFALAVLMCITVLSWLALYRSRGNLWYAGTTVWALVAVAVSNSRSPSGDPTVAMAAAGVALLTISIAIALRKSLPTNGRRVTAWVG